MAMQTIEVEAEAVGVTPAAHHVVRAYRELRAAPHVTRELVNELDAAVEELGVELAWEERWTVTGDGTGEDE